MFKIVNLDEAEMARMSRIFLEEKPKSWQELREHYVSHWPAGHPGSAHNDHEYMYENNGDMPPDVPWDNVVKCIFEFFTVFNGEKNMSNFVAYVSKNAHPTCFYEFCNCDVKLFNLRRASRRLIPKAKKAACVKSRPVRHRGKKLDWYRIGGLIYCMEQGDTEVFTGNEKETSRFFKVSYRSDTYIISVRYAREFHGNLLR